MFYSCFGTVHVCRGQRTPWASVFTFHLDSPAPLKKKDTLKKGFLSIGLLPEYLSVLHVLQCLWRPEDDFPFPETGVIDDCEPPCGSWELKPDLLEEQPVLLTTEPSLQLHIFSFKVYMVSVGLLWSLNLDVITGGHSHSYFC